MGFFGDYIFDGQLWHDLDTEQDLFESAVEPWLAIQIHDSDFATGRYAPAGSGSGVAYFGTTPRVHFADETASPPTDVERECGAIATWLSTTAWSTLTSGGDVASVVRAFLATDDEPETDADAEVNDADVFAEIKARQFLEALGLPVPDDLKD